MRSCESLGFNKNASGAIRIAAPFPAANSPRLPANVQCVPAARSRIAFRVLALLDAAAAKKFCNSGIAQRCFRSQANHRSRVTPLEWPVPQRTVSQNGRKVKSEQERGTISTASRRAIKETYSMPAIRFATTPKPGATLQVSFEPTFQKTPSVVVTPFWPNKQAVGAIETLLSVSPQGFTVNSGNFADDYFVSWIAISDE